MNEETGSLEGVKKSLDDLDREVDSFLEVIRDARKMKSSVEELHERLRAHEGEVAQRKKELEKLITSSQGLVEGISEQTRGVLTDMEKKADAMVAEVKDGIARIGSVCEQGRDELRGQQREQAEELAKKYEDIRSFCASIQEMMDTHEQKMDALKKEYGKAAGFYEKIESSLGEMKKAVYEVQKKPYEMDSRLKRAEERLEQMINDNYARQKNFSIILLLVIIASVFFSIIALYLQ